MKEKRGESIKGIIRSIYPKGLSTVYKYVCHGEGGTFSIPVEWRYHLDILELEGNPIGRLVEYLDETDPPMVRFLD